MKIVIGNRRTLGIDWISYIFNIYILIMSGSVLQYAHMRLLSQLNTIITMAVFVLFCLKKKGRGLFYKKNMCDIFVLISAAGILMSMLVWGEIGSFAVYLSVFSMLLFPWMVCKTISFDRFINAYLKIIFFLAIVSCALYWVPELLSLMPFKFSITETQWKMDFYLIYAKYSETIYKVFDRNIGIFWEPGMYQGFIVFAMMCVAIKRRFGFKAIIYQVVMTLTLLTIQSTTGYLLLLPVILIYILQRVHEKWKNLQIIITVLVCICVLIFAVYPEIIYKIMDWIKPGMSRKLTLTNEGGSMGTRFYGMLIDAYLAIRNPLGIGLLEVDKYRASTAGILRYVVDGANINTTFTMMLYYGMVPGAMYLFMLIKGCLKLNRNRLISILMMVVLFIIINTEPHYMTLFFTTVIMYAASPAVAQRKQR